MRRSILLTTNIDSLRVDDAKPADTSVCGFLAGVVRKRPDL
jgi:hypothetical protein